VPRATLLAEFTFAWEVAAGHVADQDVRGDSSVMVAGGAGPVALRRLLCGEITEGALDDLLGLGIDDDVGVSFEGGAAANARIGDNDDREAAGTQ
jgi:hypothetical protein